MTAQVVSKGPAYVAAECDATECHDVNGRPWSQLYSRKTIEGARLAERDAKDHNKARH